MKHRKFATAVLIRRITKELVFLESIDYRLQINSFHGQTLTFNSCSQHVFISVSRDSWSFTVTTYLRFIDEESTNGAKIHSK